MPAPLLYLRPELFFEELFFEEDFFEELFLDPRLLDAAVLRLLLFLLEDFLVEDLRPEDFFLLLDFLAAIWVLPPVKFEHHCTNFVASQDLDSSYLTLCRDWSVLRN
ncbi:MAG TPA: hypothetical protein VFA99_12065 [Acidobacteriaceae bacterium]|nr:hypothetical protein [Acidobacteriaceae bacterium]